MVTTLLVGAMMTVGLAACGSNQQEPASSTNSTGNKTEAAKPVTLRFAWWGNDTRHQATLKAIEAYTKLNPNVKIEAEYMGFDGYYKKLLTQFAGVTAPDLMQYSYEWHNEMADFLLDLKTSKALDLSTFDPGVMKDFGTYKDKLVMAPAGVFAAATMYNQTFTEKFGIAADTVWTWDKIMEEGKRIHAQDSKAYLLTADIDVLNKMILRPYIAQLTGKNWINDDFTNGFDKGQLVKGFTYLSDLYKNGVIEPFGDSSAFVGKMEQNPKWIKGELGMMIDYIQFYDKYKQSVQGGKLGVSGFPQAANALTSGNPIIPGTGIAVSKASKNAEEAAKFINWFLNDKDAASILETQRGIPASATARKALQDANKLQADIAKGLDLASKQKSLAPNIISSNAEINQIVKDLLEKVIYQKVTPEQAADELLKAYEPKLKELKAK